MSGQRAVGLAHPEVESPLEKADSNKMRILQRYESPEYRASFDADLSKGRTGGRKSFSFHIGG